MRVLAFSGVEIPWSTLSGFIDLSTPSFQTRLDLVIAIAANESIIPPIRLAEMCCSLIRNLSKGTGEQAPAYLPSTEE